MADRVVEINSLSSGALILTNESVSHKVQEDQQWLLSLRRLVVGVLVRIGNTALCATAWGDDCDGTLQLLLSLLPVERPASLPLSLILPDATRLLFPLGTSAPLHTDTCWHLIHVFLAPYILHFIKDITVFYWYMQSAGPVFKSNVCKRWVLSDVNHWFMNHRSKLTRWWQTVTMLTDELHNFVFFYVLYMLQALLFIISEMHTLVCS